MSRRSKCKHSLTKQESMDSERQKETKFYDSETSTKKIYLFMNKGAMQTESTSIVVIPLI